MANKQDKKTYQDRNLLTEEAKVRLAFLEFYNKVGDVSLVCRTFNISRPTFYKWLKRYKPTDLSSLEDKSKAPIKRRKSTLSKGSERKIKDLRSKNIHLGKDKLQPLFEEVYGEKVSKHHIQQVIQKYNLYPTPAEKIGQSTVAKHEELDSSVDVKEIMSNLKFPVFTIHLDKSFVLSRPVILGVAALIAATGIGLSIMLASDGEYKNDVVQPLNTSQENNNNGQVNGSSKIESDNKELLLEISKLIDLPSNEEPTVATVTDESQLDDHPFFNQAQNGDKILLFSKARKAILYDPVANKVINVAPIDIEQ